MRRLEWLAKPWRLVLLVLIVIALPLFALGEFIAADTRARLVAVEQAATDAAAGRASDLLATRLASLEDEVVGAARNREFISAINGTDRVALQRFVDDYKSAISSDIERLVLALPSVGSNVGSGGTLLARVPASETDPPVGDYIPLLDPQSGPFHVQTFRIITHVTSSPGLVISVRPAAGQASLFLAEVPLVRVAEWVTPLLSAAREIEVIDDHGRVIASASDRGTQSQLTPFNAVDALGNAGYLSSTATLPSVGWKVIAIRPPITVAAFDDAAGEQRVLRVALLMVLVVAAFVTGSVAAQLRRERQDLRDANARLDAASEAKSRFLAAVSHDLRTPLNAILGFSDVLLQRLFGELNAKQEEYLRDIHGAGEHQLALVNDLLDLSKIEAGKMELHPVPFSMRELIDGAIAITRQLADAKGIRLEGTVAADVGTVEQDPARLKQVVLNLLSNAIKFTDAGGAVRADVTAADGRVTVAVMDTGVGISPEDQAAVFEEFRQVGASARSAQGTGLGLALVRGFVRMMGGEVSLRSVVGEGSTFTVVIPLKRRISS